MKILFGLVLLSSVAFAKEGSLKQLKAAPKFIVGENALKAINETLDNMDMVVKYDYKIDRTTLDDKASDVKLSPLTVSKSGNKVGFSFNSTFKKFFKSFEILVSAEATIRKEPAQQFHSHPCQKQVSSSSLLVEDGHKVYIDLTKSSSLLSENAKALTLELCYLEMIDKNGKTAGIFMIPLVKRVEGRDSNLGDDLIDDVLQDQVNALWKATEKRIYTNMKKN